MMWQKSSSILNEVEKLGYYDNPNTPISQYPNTLYNMNDLIKNPFFVFLAGLIALWLVFKVLKVFISLFGLIVLAFVVLCVVNARFRALVQNFFSTIFRNNN